MNVKIYATDYQEDKLNLSNRSGLMLAACSAAKNPEKE